MKEKDFDEIFDEVTTEKEGSDEETETLEEEVTKSLEGELNEEGKKKDKPEPTYEELLQQYKSLQGMFEHETTRTKELEEKFNKFLEESKPKQDEKPKPEETDAELEKYIQDYDYIHKNEAKLRKKEYETLKKEMWKEISEKYDISIKSAEKLIEDKVIEEENKHIKAISEVHSDYGKDFQHKDIVDWINTLSPSIKKAYMEIVVDGTTEEVIELITDYKEAKSMKVSTNKDNEKDMEKVDTDKEKEKKLKEMEVVKGKKSPVGGSMKGAEDFDSAFDEATSVK